MNGEMKFSALEDSAHLPGPDVLALETAEDRSTALSQFESIAEDAGA